MLRHDYWECNLTDEKLKRIVEIRYGNYFEKSWIFILVWFILISVLNKNVWRKILSNLSFYFLNIEQEFIKFWNFT